MARLLALLVGLSLTLCATGCDDLAAPPQEQTEGGESREPDAPEEPEDDSGDERDDDGRDGETDGVGCDGQTYDTVADTPYVLPFPDGAAYRMNLGNCASSFHSPGSPDRYAYDFGMPIGTLITAARAGRVVHVVESGEDGGHPNNLVVVDHGDGTFAQYMHLTQSGADVSVGDDVAQGDAIGRSGATGLAGYPHLHFIVTSEAWPYPYDPVPVVFGNAEPAHRVLHQGVVYRAGGI